MTISPMLRKIRTRLKAGSLLPVESDADHYLRTGRRPWSRGYCAYKDAYITARLADPAFLRGMADKAPLPAGYGEFLDERVVEYPWLFSRLAGRAGSLLDAGSVLNF